MSRPAAACGLSLIAALLLGLTGCPPGTEQPGGGGEPADSGQDGSGGDNAGDSNAGGDGSAGDQADGPGVDQGDGSGADPAGAGSDQGDDGAADGPGDSNANEGGGSDADAGGDSDADQDGDGSGDNAGDDDAALAVPQVFPSDNPWNTDISGFPVHANSDAFIASIGRDSALHPDFGTVWEGAPIGIPYVLVHGDQPKVPVSFEYADESDPGPYPIPADVPIEGGPDSDGDRHVLLIDVDNDVLYELFAAYPLDGGARWEAGSGAIWDLTSNAQRPQYWTSADAAGLPIFAGLVRYDEVVEKGEINHALRFTVSRTQHGFIAPATHFASSHTDPDLPPMGLRVRLKAGFDVSGFTPNVRVILRAMQRYGMIVADNGSDWYVSGAPDVRWSDDELRQLRDVHGRDFEVVETGEIVTD